MGRRRYSSGKSSASSWANFGYVHWPHVIRPAYRTYFSVFEPIGGINRGMLQPSYLKMILRPAGQPALAALRERSAAFSEVGPKLSGDFPAEPIHPGEPPPTAAEPQWRDFAPVHPKLGFIDGILHALSGGTAAREKVAKDRFKIATDQWRRERYSLKATEDHYKASLQRYRQDLPVHRSKRSELEGELEAELQRYQDHPRRYEEARKADLAALDDLIAKASTGKAEHLEALAKQILRSIIAPIHIAEGVEVAFDPADRIMLFTVPMANMEEIELVGVNLRLAYTNRQNGQRMNEIVGSLAATREEFKGINIAEVDPKLCFRSLKGVAAPSFQDLSPVRPLLTFDRADKRIVESRAVVDELSSETNLAAMDWEDFEHVVRELFSKMFSARSEAAEVHVTRASRDYGVDALIYDPDPIHGGKFVIQAKRYVNTVGVAAVRDLFGTVQNEGANRGYLVTTSSFGPDAYAFAKGKPLTLIDGSHLLQLLREHGYSFRINIREARQPYMAASFADWSFARPCVASASLTIAP